MDKKQTAVEWLVEQIKSDQNQKSLSASEWMQVINQAKQMEKEQSFEFWQGGINCTEEGGKSFEQYYNETYGKQNSTADPDRMG